MVAKSGIEPVNGVFAVVFKIKSACVINKRAHDEADSSHIRTLPR